MAQKKKSQTKAASVKTVAGKGSSVKAHASVKKPLAKAPPSKSHRPAGPSVKAAAPVAAKAATAVKSAKPAEIKAVGKAPVVMAKPAKTVAAPASRPGVKAPPVQAKPAAGEPAVHAAKPAVPAKAPVAVVAQAGQAKPASAQPQQALRAVPAAKPAGPKITAPVSQPPMTPKAIAEKAAQARQQQLLAQQKKPVSSRHGFKTNEFIVYPAHGVGRIVGIEEQEIAGMSLELFVITFDKEKLTLRVPTGKLASVGMRKLADDDIVRKAIDTLKGRARVKRTMWSRRAQEYVAKINSGDLVSIAEVVRDLYRSEAQPEQSYSERQLYEDALDRMAREIAAVEKLDERGAVQRITEVLSKSARGRRVEGGEGGLESDVKAA